MATLTAVAIPQSLVTLDRSRAFAAARYFAARVALARAQAAKRSAYVALRFEHTGSDIAFGMFVDGNRNGVRTRDIERNIDRPLERAVSLSDLFPGVAIGLSTGSAEGAGPLRIGSTRLLSFSPLGSATSGSIYIRGRDGSQLAVRIFGVTGRARVLRYVPRTRAWIDASF
ncbi:MAG: GspH/FimT family pseudopilin [Acidobacteria bacterium]|nr:GspH/FimT family pseudopilin [Acidobacteriota bacterium]